MTHPEIQQSSIVSVRVSRRPQFQAFRVTTQKGEEVDQPIASCKSIARAMAYAKCGHHFPDVERASDLVAQLIGEEE